MSKFEVFFDEFVEKAKSVADTAGKKTSEIVDIGKIRYQIKQTQWDIDKVYSKLGAIVYESRKSNENFDEVIDLAVGEVDLLGERMEELKERLRAHKKVTKCPSCGKENDIGFAFCSRCGVELEIKDESDPDMVTENDVFEAPVEDKPDSDSDTEN